jgi:DNA helicase-2/ATP-dependent DNA helicase PcrA
MRRLFRGCDLSIPVKTPVSSLNEEQEAATRSTSSRTLVIASAGTGKTSTIIGRVAVLLERGVPPEKIMLLTFTNEASVEMRERIKNKIDANAAEKMTIGTFHAVALSILKKHSSGFQLKQGDASKNIFQAAYYKVFVKQDANALGPTAIMERYGLYLNQFHNLPFSQWVHQDMRSKNNKYDGTPDPRYDAVVDAYEQMKKTERIVDFNDLLIKAKKLLAHIRLEIDEVIIDEFQDTNPLQKSVIDVLQPKSWFCVGDYDQSIYSFNGSDINIIKEFGADAEVYMLSKNYRSSAPIVKCAESLISNNERIFEKKFEALSLHPEFFPEFHKAEFYHEQFERVVGDIKRFGYKFQDCAIIYRSNGVGDDIETTLKMHNIDYNRRGGKSFFDASDIVFVREIYRVLTDQSDINSFLTATQYINGLNTYQAKIVYDKLRLNGEGDLLKGMKFAAGSFVKVFGKSINKLSSPGLKNLLKLSGRTNIPPTGLVDIILDSDFVSESIDNYIGRFAKDRNEAIDARQKIFKKTKILRDIASQCGSHKAFVYAIQSKQKSTNDEIGEQVSLYTVHASKGLEFPHVFIIDVDDSVFPHKRLMQSGGVEEERRLFYVALTRAQKTLRLYTSAKRKRGGEGMVSRFITEAQIEIC